MAMRTLWSMGLAAVVSMSGIACAAAGPAPPQLRNKSIITRFVLQVHQRAPDGRFANPAINVGYTVYVSSAGRSFIRQSRSINNPYFTASRTSEAGPGQSQSGNSETREMQFSGGRLIGNAAFISGAARMQIGFDPAYTRCDVSVQFGKAGGAPIRWKGLDGVLYTVESVTTTGNTCAIQDGNAFAG